ncbi:hypothetical protein NDU88_011018 [Pleurodeles waltl]|uniref:Secreted protein n=1 Tax=Pleurodeles waltl TaxID=8319 RepID=A0AAV7QWB9_PLEWA|nr:hypothetical protein NDU88_011018 [Pleurodeles waltl]
MLLVRICVPASAPCSAEAGVVVFLCWVAPGVRVISPCSRQVFWFLLSKARVQPSRGSEVAAIVVPRGHRGDTLCPSQLLFFARRRLLHIYQAGFRSLVLTLPFVFGAWKCNYFGRAPFTAPERHARRAASSAAGHPPPGYNDL